MEIKTLFDSNKNIYRTIEKVITYDVSQEERLKSEISEYIVTENIEEQFEKLLIKMHAAMEAGGQNEVGVWVSGFYGSGKSSFTKYLGLAFDDNIKIDGTPFIQHLQDKLKKSTTRTLLNSVVKRFPAAVLMLDLASEQLAGATMVEISTVLYYKVLQWAGYSRNLKVAAFERKLKKDSYHNKFLQVFSEHTEGLDWKDYRNDELLLDSVIPEIAHKIYPALFKTPSSFTTEASEVIRFENDRVEEMIEIVREASGKEYIIFIIDEIGQYVGSRQNLILNLDGLAKNLKNIGNGKVWIIGTAQQTLTENNPRASFNSPELYKLKDRFSIQIDLEANDIKEICYSRLLGKSLAGESELGALFDRHGQALRNHTKLVDARSYGADLDKQTFIDLYPFLPVHFDILLHLLSTLAKSTGGIGLRSAIKVIQEILVEDADGATPIANQPVGRLVNTMTLFGALKKDIEKGYLSLYGSSCKVKIRFPNSELHQNIAKTVHILQILNNLPISHQNITCLMHAYIADSSNGDAVKQAIDELINDAIVPFGEQEGNLCFFSEKLNHIEQERATIPLHGVGLRKIQNESIREAYFPLPSAYLNATLSVQTGLKAQNVEGIQTSLAVNRNTIQTIVELVNPKDYEATKSHLTQESRHKTAQYNIFIFGRTVPEIEELINDIYRCRKVADKYHKEPDQEVKKYCEGQNKIANRKLIELVRLVKRSLVQGSFIFRGEVTAVESISQELIEAARKHLGTVAEQVFDRYNEAPVRVNTNLAERFLSAINLADITSEIDPLSLVRRTGGHPTINTNHKAVTSIRDRIENQGSIEGKRLSDIFTRAPYGWSHDTLRYLVAAMFVAGEVKLKVAGREITVNKQHAIDALKTNNTFKYVGVSLRVERPSTEVMKRAADRLTGLSGDTVYPLENEITVATIKLFHQLQRQYVSLAENLKALDLPGLNRIKLLAHDIEDASDAPARLGDENSNLYNSLKWASELNRAFEQGLGSTLIDLQKHRTALNLLPTSGTPSTLKSQLTDRLRDIDERIIKIDFSKYNSKFLSHLTAIKSCVRDTAITMQEEQTQRIKDAGRDLVRITEWRNLTQQEQNNLLADLEKLTVVVSKDLKGLQLIISHEYTTRIKFQDIKQRAANIGQRRLKNKLREEQEGKKKITRTLKFKEQITNMADLNQLITQLEQLHGELKHVHEFELSISLNNSKTTKCKIEAQ